MSDVLLKARRLLREGKNLFITGGGGVGKSYLLNSLTKEFNIVITSTTGISALNISGQTIHSWSGIGIANKPIDMVVKAIKQNKRRYKYILGTKILAIDEVSMLDNYTIEYLDIVLRKVTGTSRPFGGIQVILIGDFFQLPPVELGVFKKGSYVDFCFKSDVWQQLNLSVLNLTKVWRQDDKQLINSLNRIRSGNISDTSIFKSREIATVPDNTIRLYSTNTEVNSYNLERFNKLNSPEFVYESNDCISTRVDGYEMVLDPDDKRVSSWDKAIYETFDQNCKAQKVLKLKQGARVMLLKNIDVKSGLVNGSCGNIIYLDNFTVKVKFDNGKIYCVSPEDFEYLQYGLVKIRRTQIPLMLAYACSIHKSQGLTLDSVFIDFKRIFTFGQAYVALSRVRSLSGLYLKNFNPLKIKANKEVIDFYKSLEKTT